MLFFPAALVALAAALAAASEVKCQFGCGAQGEGCAAGARDTFLASVGCRSPHMRSSFLFYGGWREARYAQSVCTARFFSPIGVDTRVSCSSLYYSFNEIIQPCFVKADNGIGSNYLPNFPSTEYMYFVINTCPGWDTVITGVPAASSSRVNVQNIVDNEDIIIDETAEKHRLASFLLTSNDPEIQADSVYVFPYSNATAMTVCDLSEMEPGLKQKYGCL